MSVIQDGRVQSWWVRGKSKYGEIFRMCLKGNASSIYHMSHSKRPWNHGHMLTFTNTVCECVCTSMQTFFTHARDDVRTWRDLIGLLHLSRASVNFSPLMVSKVFPRRKCDNLLSTNPVMPHRALKSSMQPCWNGFLWLNHLRMAACCSFENFWDLEQKVIISSMGYTNISNVIWIIAHPYSNFLVILELAKCAQLITWFPSSSWS